MCGILGCNFQTHRFQAALDKLYHRGPDYEHIVTYDNCLFGHTRLAIIDLNAEANQPMEFDDIIITFNGEIYNYKELIVEHNLKVYTKSDTEVLIRLYQKYAFDFLNFINGMFSFTIYDKNKKRFFCARDRFGKKPFFYYCKNTQFIYASEIKAIVTLLKKTPHLNKQAFNEFLRFNSPIYNNTIYDDIYKLPAGHYLVFDTKLHIQKWYNLESLCIKESTEIQNVQEIEKLLHSSVEARLVGDVEIASLLSGGLDSSFISALYSKFANKQIHTYSIGYDEYHHYNELEYAKIVAKHIQSNHSEVILSKKQFLETIDKVLDATDEPFGDSATVPTYILSQKIHTDGIKVALSGEGSDEIFLGYDNYKKILNYYDQKTFINTPFNLTKEWEYEQRALNNTPIFYSSGETFTQEQTKQLLYEYQDIVLPYHAEYEAVRWLSYADIKYWIENVLTTKVDRASMANSLEVRSPFLDYRIVEYMFSVNDNIKQGNTTKYLLKQIAMKYLPHEIVHRQKKGFSSPFIEWLYDEYKEELLETILRVNRELNIFNVEFVKFLYYEAKEQRFKQHFYNLYIFARWYQKVYM
jgi:asparagine synthase (glutamine-hydrolysing)